MLYGEGREVRTVGMKGITHNSQVCVLVTKVGLDDRGELPTEGDPA